MQFTHLETSPLKAGRRVLGEKTTNASLTPSTKRSLDLQKSTADAIPFTQLKELRKDRDTSPHSQHAGQKRTIDQVTEDAESIGPRKAPMSRQSEVDKDFQIFDEDARSKSPQRENVSQTDVTTTQASEVISSPPKDDLLKEAPEESSRSTLTEFVTRVPTEPAARRIFIQEKAALVKRRLQSAMRRVENNSLDRALSQFEASSRRPFLTSGPTITTSASPSSSIYRVRTASQTPPPKQQRVLLPPLPIQPRPRPVRSSARKSIPSPTLESASIASQEEEEEEEEEKEEDGEETPKAQAGIRQRSDTDVDETKGALTEEGNALVLTQCSTNSDRTVGQ